MQDYRAPFCFQLESVGNRAQAFDRRWAPPSLSYDLTQAGFTKQFNQLTLSSLREKQ